MIRKLMFSALAVASLATAAPASAGQSSHYSNGDVAIAGAVIGLAVGLIASQSGYNQQYDQGGYDQECFDKPVRKWRHGRLVVVGYRTVCR